MKRYVVTVGEDSSYGYWEMLDDGSKRSADLKYCDKFRFWIFSYLFYMDQIAYGSNSIWLKNC